MAKQNPWVIKMIYADGDSTYVLRHYSRADGRALFVPNRLEAERFVSKKAAESWFDTIRRYWCSNKEYELVAEQLTDIELKISEKMFTPHQKFYVLTSAPIGEWVALPAVCKSRDISSKQVIYYCDVTYPSGKISEAEFYADKDLTDMFEFKSSAQIEADRRNNE